MKLIEKELEDMKIELGHPGSRSSSLPEKQVLDACHEFGRKIGRRAVNGQ